MLDAIEKSLQRITLVHRQHMIFFAVCSKTISITSYFNKNMSSENCSVPSISFLRGLYFLLNSSPILLGSLWTARKMMPELFPSYSSAFLIESAWKMCECRTVICSYTGGHAKTDLILQQSRAMVAFILKFTGEKSNPLLDFRHPVRELMFPIACYTKLRSGI